MNKIHTLQKNIMRRIYYAYGIAIATHPVTLHAIGVAVMVVALTYFVSFPHVIENISNVQVGRVGHYMVVALARTEIWTQLLLSGIIFALFSLRIQLRPHHFHREVGVM